MLDVLENTPWSDFQCLGVQNEALKDMQWFKNSEQRSVDNSELNNAICPTDDESILAALRCSNQQSFNDWMEKQSHVHEKS